MHRHNIFILIVVVIGVAVVLAACSKEPMGSTSTSSVAGRLAAQVPDSTGSNPNGIGGAEPAYYDSMLFTINFKEMPDKAAENILAHNPGFNIIYEMDEIPGGDFVDVIDAIPGDGMNPLWREVDVVFNEGFTPHQFYSDDEVLAAASGDNPEITLVVTDEVYRCSVIGAKP